MQHDTGHYPFLYTETNTQLYYMPGAFPLAAHIVLERMGAPFEIVEVKREALKNPEYLGLNPMGVVPTLLDGDFVLAENVASMLYLAETHPHARLAGADDARSRAQVKHWLGFLNSDLHQSFKPLFSPDQYLTEESQNADLAVHAKARLLSLFALVDAAQSQHAWLAGTQRSIVDPYLYVLLRWAHAKAIDLGRMDNLHRFFQHMCSDSAFKPRSTPKDWTDSRRPCQRCRGSGAVLPGPRTRVAQRLSIGTYA